MRVDNNDSPSSFLAGVASYAAGLTFDCETATGVDSSLDSASCIDYSSYGGYDADIPQPASSIDNDGQQQAQECISNFCQSWTDATVTPSNEALERCWSKCSLIFACSFDATAIASAISDQLHFPGGDVAWQPRARALHMLEYMLQKGPVGEQFTVKVARIAGLQLRVLSSVPECSELASRVADHLLGEETTFDGDWTDIHRESGVEEIRGNQWLAAEGGEKQLIPIGKKQILVRDTVFWAELKDGQIVWCTGEIWIVDTRRATFGDDVREFEVRLQKGVSVEGSNLGVSIARGRRELILKDVQPGLVQDWNERNPESQVMRRDWICAVNGIEGNGSRLLKTVKDSTELILLIRRPMNKSSEFTIKLNKGPDGKAKLGVDIAKGENELRIGGIRDGLVHLWNALNPCREVQYDDRICVVNGKKGTSEELLTFIIASRELELLIMRPPEGDPRHFTITIDRNERGSKLGVDILEKDGFVMQIAHVKEGLISKWNAENPDKEVVSGDCIVAVNGVRGSSTDLLSLIKGGSPFELTIRQAAAQQALVDFPDVNDKESVFKAPGVKIPEFEENAVGSLLD